MWDLHLGSHVACGKLVSPKNLGSIAHLGTIPTLFTSLKVLALYATKHVFAIYFFITLQAPYNTHKFS